MMKHKTGDDRPQDIVFEENENWIIACGPTKSFEAVKKKLRAHKEIWEQVENIVVPQSRHVRYTRSGSVIITETMFPGYFFIATKSRTVGWQEMVDKIEEIWKMLTINTEEGEPRVAFVDRKDKDRILEMMKAVQRETITKSFTEGDKVAFTKGSFRGLNGKIIEINNKRPEATVDLVMGPKVIPTTVSLYELEKVEEED